MLKPHQILLVKML